MLRLLTVLVISLLAWYAYGDDPTGQPSRHPTGQPSGHPTGQPSGHPTGQPSGHPTGQPSRQPTGQPTRRPSRQPTSDPTNSPKPSFAPTALPSRAPSAVPTQIFIGTVSPWPLVVSMSVSGLSAYDMTDTLVYSLRYAMASVAGTSVDSVSLSDWSVYSASLLLRGRRLAGGLSLSFSVVVFAIDAQSAQTSVRNALTLYPGEFITYMTSKAVELKGGLTDGVVPELVVGSISVADTSPTARPTSYLEGRVDVFLDKHFGGHSSVLVIALGGAALLAVLLLVCCWCRVRRGCCGGKAKAEEKDGAAVKDEIPPFLPPADTEGEEAEEEGGGGRRGQGFIHQKQGVASNAHVSPRDAKMHANSKAHTPNSKDSKDSRDSKAHKAKRPPPLRQGQGQRHGARAATDTEPHQTTSELALAGPPPHVALSALSTQPLALVNGTADAVLWALSAPLSIFGATASNASLPGEHQEGGDLGRGAASSSSDKP